MLVKLLLEFLIIFTRLEHRDSEAQIIYDHKQEALQ